MRETWDKCSNNLGIRGNDFEQQNKSFGSPDFGDGKLEFLSFGSISGLGNERFIHGWAKRIEFFKLMGSISKYLVLKLNVGY